jgi:hypothetical protein
VKLPQRAVRGFLRIPDQLVAGGKAQVALFAQRFSDRSNGANAEVSVTSLVDGERFLEAFPNFPQVRGRLRSGFPAREDRAHGQLDFRTLEATLTNA